MRIHKKKTKEDLEKELIRVAYEKKLFFYNNFTEEWQTKIQFEFLDFKYNNIYG